MPDAATSQFITVSPGNAYSVPALKSMNLAPLTAGVDQTLTTIELAFRYVPWFRRACKLRAGAVKGFPLELLNKAGDDVSEQPEYQPVMLWTRKMLGRIEMNLVKYGAAYHLLETNKFGLNVTPRFIPSPVVQPIIDYANAGLTGFNIAWYADSGEYPLNRMIWIWEPNDESEIWPGTSDGASALKAAGLLYAIDEMVNRYMGSGGVPVTAVRVPATVDKEERNKIEGFLTRVAGGFRNAFKFMVIDKNTEFETIGSEMKDLQSVELTGAQRDNVAVAMGVPPTVIDGKSANYATADSEMAGFYMNTIIPDMEMFEPELNTQLYSRLGLTLKAKPDELRVFKGIKQKDAAAVFALTGGKPLVSVNEARGMVDFDPVMLPNGEPDPQYDELTPLPPKVVAAPFGGSPSQLTSGASGGSTGSPDAAPADLLKKSLAQFKAGQSAAVGVWFDGELEAASSGNMIRNIHSAHRLRQSAPSLDERRVSALEEYNALVRAGSVPSHA